MEILAHPRHAFADRKILVQRIADCSGYDHSLSHVLLDGEDYSKDTSVLDEFRDLAFYWNRDRPKDRVPAHIHEFVNTGTRWQGKVLWFPMLLTC